jgi:hypothetical protein
MSSTRIANPALVSVLALLVVGPAPQTQPDTSQARAFAAECGRIYESSACLCAAERIATAIGAVRYARVGSEIFMHPQLHRAATQVVQSCMPGADEIAD